MWEIFQGKSIFTVSQLYITAVVLRDDLWIYVFSGKIRCCVHMCDKADGWSLFHAFCSRDHAINIALIINAHVLNSYLFQFLCQLFSQVKLAAGGRHVLLLILACGIYFHII